MSEVMTIGEIICETMREKLDCSLGEVGTFIGPYPSGAPAIFIDTMAKLGHQAGIFSAVGNDTFGKAALQGIRNDGVDDRYIQVHDDLPTSAVFIGYESSGERDFMFYIGNAASGRIDIPEALPDDVKAFHISGPVFTLSEQVAENAIKLVRYYAEAGAVITFDPNWREQLMRGKNVKPYFDEMLEKTDIFLPGDQELMYVTGQDTVEDAVRYVWSEPQYQKIKVIAVKSGSKGSRIFTREDEFFVPVYQIAEVDPTGAGDTYDAGFTSAYLRGKSVEECADFASMVAAVNTQSLGGMSARMREEDFKHLLKQTKRG